MIRIPGGLYYTVEEYRQMIGYSSAQPIYRAIKEGRLVGGIRFGNSTLIPSGSVIVDRKLKSGTYVGVSRLIQQNKEGKKNGI